MTALEGTPVLSEERRQEFEDALHGPDGAELEDDDEALFWLSVAEIKALLHPSEGIHVPSGWIVDYDIPADSRRKRFYRRVRRYLREAEAEETSWSTASVVFTGDEDFARMVYHAALAVGGKSHLYRAEIVMGGEQRS